MPDEELPPADAVGQSRPVLPFALGALAGVAVAVLVVVLVVVVRDDGDETLQTTDTIPETTEVTIRPTVPVVEEPPDTVATDPAPSGSTSDWGAVPAVPVECPQATTRVDSAEALESALAAAQPGTVIQLAPGTYEGKFVATTSGTEDEPIFLCGPADAVIDGGGVKEGYALHLDGVSDWRLVGFTVRNTQKGVMADGVTRSVIQGLTVEDVGDEAIHLRAASTNNAVVDNVIRRTGLRRDKFGEGIYVGSAQSNWSEHSGGGPDRSDDNLVQGNTISQTTSEAIDIKEGTTGGRLVGNVIDAAGMSAADSPVDVKGNGWLIQGNVVRDAPEEGMQTHRILDGWGTDNRFEGNTVDVVGDGLHFYVHDPEVTDNQIGCDNRTAAGSPVRSTLDCVP
ncbi:MAG TPA: right-handed parallel beta-helix repeat-containing protein [Acidimicrobiales bacterium]